MDWASQTANLQGRRPLFEAIFLRVIAFLAISVCSMAAHSTSDDGITIRVEVQGSEVTADVEFSVPATLEETWEVLTDYGHATAFVSGLERSAILSRVGDTLVVSQKGRVDYGPFSTTFETVAEIQLFPFETIRSYMISGNMKKNQSTTLITPEDGGVRVVHHLESIPNVWIPPIIGRILIAHEVRNRFRQLIAEILSRKGRGRDAGYPAPLPRP